MRLWNWLKQFLPTQAVEAIEVKAPALVETILPNYRRRPAQTTYFNPSNQLGFKPPTMGKRNEKGV